MTPLAKPEARPRERQADRSAHTRARVLSAAIGVLHARGYAATTTVVVADEAGVSRGAMQHQFPTKTDLMLFVVRAVFDEEMDFYAERLRLIPEPMDKALALPELVWEALSRPSGVAVLEILQGSRSDPVLAERLAPLQAQIERESFAPVAQAKAQLGELASLPMIRLIHWAIRGMSVAQLVAEKPEEVRDSVGLLKRMMAALVREAIGTVGT